MSCAAETVSIAVNIGILMDQLGKDTVPSPIENFRAADKNINPNTPVERVIASSNALWYALELTSATDNQGSLHDIDLAGEAMNSAYAASTQSWSHATPIIDTYIYAKDDKARTLTIHGIKDAQGSITLTVWAIGDNVKQQALITPTYGGKTLEEKWTNFGDKKKHKINSTPYVQFPFPADGKTDSISFQWSNPHGLSCLNGFSLSYEKE